MATLNTVSVLYLVLSIILVFEAITISMKDVSHPKNSTDDVSYQKVSTKDVSYKKNSTENIISYGAMRANHAWGCSPKYPQFCNKTEANPYTKV
ncbi:unnamed protein product [Eruca vesicaria subsp. sativa]|uniref:Uncharacterized protein n=1 Tax=Eruca vesicaria subsp. sativa TaxID=29727 RepID=A0ABC8KYU7_ERUVS|nr:unnamed protein product [Eruca vesicaria subsp. sativa]